MNNIKLAAYLLEGAMSLEEADLEVSKQGEEIKEPASEVKKKNQKVAKTPEQIEAERAAGKEKMSKISAQEREVKEKAEKRGEVARKQGGSDYSLLLIVTCIVHVIREQGIYNHTNSGELGLVAPHTVDLVHGLLKDIDSGAFKITNFSEKDKSVAAKIYNEYPNAKNELLFGKRLFKPKGVIAANEVSRLVAGIGTYMIDARLIDTFEAKREYWEKFKEEHKSEFRLDREKFEASVEAGLKEKAKMITKIKEWCEDDFMGETGASVTYRVKSVTKVLISGFEKASSKKLSEDEQEEETQAALSNVVKLDLEALERALAAVAEKEGSSDESESEADELGDIEESLEIDGMIYFTEKKSDVEDAKDAVNTTKESVMDRLRKTAEKLAASKGDSDEEADSQAMARVASKAKAAEEKIDGRKDAVIDSQESVKNILLTIYGFTSDDKPFYLAAAYGKDERRSSVIHRIFSKFPSFDTLRTYSKKAKLPSNGWTVNEDASVTAIVKGRKYVKIAAKDINPATGEVYGNDTGKRDVFKIVDLEDVHREKLSSIKQAFRDSGLYRGLTLTTVNVKADGTLKKADQEDDEKKFNLADVYFREGVKKVRQNGGGLGAKDETVAVQLESFRVIKKKTGEDGEGYYFMYGKTRTGEMFTMNVPFADIKRIFGYLPSNPEAWKNLPDKIKQNELTSKGFKPSQKVIVKGFGLAEKATGDIFSARKFAEANGLDLLKKAMTSEKTLLSEFVLITKIKLA